MKLFGFLVLIFAIAYSVEIEAEGGLGDGKCASSYCRPEAEACRATGKSCSDHIAKCAGQFALSVKKG